MKVLLEEASGEAMPEQDKALGRSQPRLRRVVTDPVVLALVAVVCVAHFVDGHLPWLTPFFRDFSHWVVHPTIAGYPSVPAGLDLVLPYVAISGLCGWLGARALMAGSSWSQNRPVVYGMAGLLALSSIGFVGMLAVICGELTRSFIVLGEVLLYVALTTLRWWQEKRNRSQLQTTPLPPADSPPERASNALRWVALVVVFLVLALVVFHVILSPVTEWDAVTYHAATAKLWYLQRPHPPLSYGPSIGTEISINYPPLYPAIGAALYVVAGHFQDLYLRLVSPLLFMALLAMVFGCTRARFSARAAWWALILMCGAPVDDRLRQLANRLHALDHPCLRHRGDGRRRRRKWGARRHGSEQGSSGDWPASRTSSACWSFLWHFRPYSSFGAKQGPFLGGARRHRISSGVTVVSAKPDRTGRPLYPLGIPFFHGKGLDNAMYRASEAEISNNAKGWWGYHSTFLWFRKFGTALWDRHLLPVGMFLGPIACLPRLRRGDRRLLWLCVCVAILIGTQLLIGWYWFAT